MTETNYCDKTFVCCRDLHEAHQSFGGLFTSARCVFRFRADGCGALRDPTEREMRLFAALQAARKIEDELRRQIVTMSFVDDERYG